MNKINIFFIGLFVTSFFIAGSIIATVFVANKTPWPIQFAATWEADTSNKSGKWSDVIAPNTNKMVSDGDLWNAKIRYKARAKIGSNWEEVFNNSTHKLGNRQVTVFADANGNFNWTDSIF